MLLLLVHTHMHTVYSVYIYLLLLMLLPGTCNFYLTGQFFKSYSNIRVTQIPRNEILRIIVGSVLSAGQISFSHTPNSIIS